MIVIVVGCISVLAFGSANATRSAAVVGETAGTGTAQDMREPVRTVAGGSCPDARRGVAFYRAKTWAWQRKGYMRRLADRTPIVAGKSCRWARHAAGVWRDRARAAQARWVTHWAWWRWLPANWAALGSCETGYGKRPGNWRHANAKYVSAFGISRVEYDADAAHYGAPPWNDEHPPTLRQQYDAARGHYARFGDGWTCPGP